MHQDDGGTWHQDPWWGWRYDENHPSACLVATSSLVLGYKLDADMTDTFFSPSSCSCGWDDIDMFVRSINRIVITISLFFDWWGHLHNEAAVGSHWWQQAAYQLLRRTRDRRLICAALSLAFECLRRTGDLCECSLRLHVKRNGNESSNRLTKQVLKRGLLYFQIRHIEIVKIFVD